MKVTDILNEDQLDELSLDGFGRGVGAVARGASKIAGATAGGIAGMGRQFKKGYTSGNNVVGGPRANAFAPQQQQSGGRQQRAPAAQPAAQSQPQGNDPVTTISALLPKLNGKQLSSLKLAIDQYIQRSAPRSRQAAPAAQPAQAAPAATGTNP